MCHIAFPHTTDGCEMIDVGSALDLVQHTLVLALLISAPMLLVGMAVGVLVSIFQAVTQIQEQTLTFVPKIASMIFAAVLLLPWICERLLEYSAAVFGTGSLP
ncbi:MAG: flagellar biosynthesis protein FliQ [Phycisphaerales bacterium]|nr:flagellar biosynthesis protein FliQ [Phycisphaerales bacterium]